MLKNWLYIFLLCLSFGCRPSSSENRPLTNTETTTGFLSDTLFEVVNVMKMHLFATQDTLPNADMYPYTGKVLAGKNLDYLSTELQPSTVGKVYACYRLENDDSYILRTPGKYQSSDLSLAKWDPAARKLLKTATLASRWCDQEMCYQQDAWLTDLDDDRHLEIIISRRSVQPSGKVTDSSFEVWSPDAAGNLVKSSAQVDSLAIPANYVFYIPGED